MKGSEMFCRNNIGFSIITLILTMSLISCAGNKKSIDPSSSIIEDDIFSKGHQQEGSLWPGDNMKQSLFSDTKAKGVGDLVTVLIEEDASSTQSATTSTAKTSEIDLETGRLLGLPSNLGIANFLGMGSGFNPQIDAKTSRSNDGTGTTTRSGELTAKISAVIKEVLPNGNFRIEGKRTVRVNYEDQNMVLEGIIRPIDINFDNTISSTLMAEASITYEGKGVINDEQRVGWGMRIFSFIWPF